MTIAEIPLDSGTRSRGEDKVGRGKQRISAPGNRSEKGSKSVRRFSYESETVDGGEIGD